MGWKPLPPLGVRITFRAGAGVSSDVKRSRRRAMLWLASRGSFRDGTVRLRATRWGATAFARRLARRSWPGRSAFATSWLRRDSLLMSLARLPSEGWCGREDSNPRRPFGHQLAVVPLVAPGRLELTTDRAPMRESALSNFFTELYRVAEAHGHEGYLLQRGICALGVGIPCAWSDLLDGRPGRLHAFREYRPRRRSSSRNRRCCPGTRWRRRRSERQACFLEVVEQVAHGLAELVLDGCR